MAKTFKSLLSLLLAVMMVCSLMVIPSSAAKIALNKTSVTLTKGYQTTLKVSGTSSTVKWSTGDKSVATVSSKGKVVGKGPGTTYIYAKVSGTTLKCKVKVVAAKITASSSNVALDEKGDTKIVTMTVKGSHSGLSVGTTNKKVASASWVKPVEWDGDKIRLKITAKGEGDAKIKVYLKNYSSTCYKYINVTVGEPEVFEDPDDSDDFEDTNTNMTILAYTQDVKVNTNETYALQVYCTDHKNLGYQFSDSKIASVSVGTASGKYKNYTIKGLKEGTTTLRLYNKKNTKKYLDVKITVGGAGYYELTTTKPNTTNIGDKVINVQVSNTNYYMLVPANYDPAYANSIVAKKFNKYSYYTVYDQVPSMMAIGDSYKSFTNKNNTYVNPNNTNGNYYYWTSSTRYVLVPKDFDEVKYNTVVAEYNNSYDYLTVYNSKPNVVNSWYEYVTSWTINDPATGKTITRYMLVSNTTDQATVDAIIEKDKNQNNSYVYYQGYDQLPKIDTTKDTYVWYYKNNTLKYMVVPRNNVDVIKRNDAIQKDTGVYEPYVMYSTKPATDSSKGEYVIEGALGNKYGYILCTYPQDSKEHTNMFASVATNAPDGIK